MQNTGDPFLDHYQMIVEDTARLTDRRQTVNNLYLSANSLLLGGLALFVQQTEFKGFSTIFISALLVFVGIFLCRDWRRLLKTYRALINLRIELLHTAERGFKEKPDLANLVQVYHEEDQLFKPGQGKPIFGFYAIEKNLPWLFIYIYLLMLIGTIVLRFPEMSGQLAAWGIHIPGL